MTLFNGKLNTLLVSLALVSYLGVGLLGFMHLRDMADMHMPMADCPFTQTDHTMCFMLASDHIRTWQDILSTAIPLFMSLFILPLCLAFFFTIFSTPSLIRFLLYARRRLTFNNSPFQELFSQGILHSKVF